MSSVRRTLHATIVLAAAALIASGCGGGEAPVDPGAVTPTPDAGAGATTVADPGATGAVPGATDPATGLPIDPAAAPAAATATVPELVGDDVAGGLDPVSDSLPVFDAQAVDAMDIADEDKEKEEAADEADKTTTEAPKITYTGAKIYVDGIVHSVNRNGTFPKGNPVFRLLSVTAFDVEIALIAGEFTSSGGEGTYLDKGDLVSLVNASEQVTYRLKYLRPITSTTDISF